MKGYDKKMYGGNKKQNCHEDKTGYKELNHDKSSARDKGMSYDGLQKMVKKL